MCNLPTQTLKPDYSTGLTNSVARWLSPKPAKSYQEKLLDSAKSHVTNFQLKSAKNSEILLEKLLFLRFLK